MERKPRKYLSDERIKKIVTRESKYLQMQESKAKYDWNSMKVWHYVVLGMLSVLLIRLIKWLVSG
jgi:hypothetical protein